VKRVVVLDDDALQVLMIEGLLDSRGIQCRDWSKNKDLSDTRAVICDWLMPESWTKYRYDLIEKATEIGIPVAIYTVGGTTREILSETYPGVDLDVIQKSQDRGSLVKWLTKNGL